MEASITKISDINATHNETTSEMVYKNYSMLKIEDTEQAKLQEPVNLDEIEIKPDGLIYLPQVFYRQKLNDSFGIGQWALVIHRDMQQDSMLFVDGSLYVRGCFVARAIGEQQYIESNKNQSWAAVWESAKSDCITRCCKDLGISKELWSPQFVKEWINNNAVKVWVDKNGKSKIQWRKYSADPFYGETGIVNDSPNKDKYQRLNNTQPKPENNSAKHQRNYTQESQDCKTLQELQDWYSKLSKPERTNYKALFFDRESEIVNSELDKIKDYTKLQKYWETLSNPTQTRYQNLFNNRKDELMSDEIPDAEIVEEKDLFGNVVNQTDKVTIMIGVLDKTSDFEEVDTELEKVKDTTERQRLILMFKMKLKEIGSDYESKAVPF